MSPQEEVHDWKNAIPRRLVGRGSPEACDALRRMIEAIPEQEWLRELLRQAEAEVVRRNWVPRPVDAILALGTAQSGAAVESILAAGARSVAIGGNVQGLVNTGDLNIITINLDRGASAAEEPGSG